MTDTTPDLQVVNTLFGRRTIYTTSDFINADNIIEMVNNALAYHVQNLLEEEYLYWYRRNLTPVLSRTKEIRPEINNKVSANIAGSIVDFKNGYFLTKPACYVSRNEESQDKVNQLNEYLYRSGKQQVDNKLADWFHTVGKAALMIQPNDDPDVPVKAFCLDPRGAFVAYSMNAGNDPVLGVHMVIADGKLFIDAYTTREVFRLSGTTTGRYMTSQPTFEATAVNIDAVEPNVLGRIPIIEYSYNSVNMGAFEGAVDLLDAINTAESNRLDGLEQFIQSLIVTWNCKFEEGTTANNIRQYGMVNLVASGDNRQDLKILSEQLDQGQTQTLIDDLYERVMSICAMPATTRSSRVYDVTGEGALTALGWYQADAAARNTEDLFKESNAKFDEIFIDILRRKNLVDIKMSDFELQIVRNETANVQSKAQAFQTLMAAGLHPELAAGKSGISNDPVGDMQMSEQYIKMRWGDPDAPIQQPQTEIIESDRFTGDNDTGGAI